MNHITNYIQKSNLHNGVLLSYLKEWIYEISRQMDGPGVYQPEWGNPITKELTQYVLTDKWILAQKLRIPKI
jgi:flagellar biosynthesis/type III secretory pathway chaperone